VDKITAVTAVASLTHATVMVHHTLPTKTEDFTLISDQPVAHQDLILSKNHLEQAFYYIIFTYSHPFN